MVPKGRKSLPLSQVSGFQKKFEADLKKQARLEGVPKRYTSESDIQRELASEAGYLHPRKPRGVEMFTPKPRKMR